MQLTNENYHSLEADRYYMSNSQYKGFLECEAESMAYLRGEWQREHSIAMLVGSYVHAYFEGPEAFELFKASHPEIISSRGATKGELKAEFRYANTMIETIENDPLCMFVLQGRKEVIMTAEFAGAPWKIKMDCYNVENNRFADIKTTDRIHKEIWHPGLGYVSFVEAMGYLTQMALYAEIERLHAGRDGWIEPIIVAVSKEERPDKAVIGFKAYDIERELDGIRSNMQRIIEVKSGMVEPTRCERCDYCRATKQLNQIVHYTDLIGGR
ncbi:PD-(D/E)XK nuclease-like domain-containing protein [Paenibacillus ehimensis]|uniref:PD-(D/E)XK nuclease-like domain-containing protein n=1 Tax=Paenibacillus ehimensis TaxID=79264 RepID=UPI002DB7D93E|nr:PD-(D/E)XK nuclease-like domain-containing protein [Paenibacillus ehimensis]MEC0211845.1 PD-(D/E)XK nuclease-like domain-containing protein [Paenibacillus ehimensis]